MSGSRKKGFCKDTFTTLLASLKKILKQVEYESARRKNILMKKQEKEMRKALHFLYVHLPQGTQGNSIYSREALVEVMEGK